MKVNWVEVLGYCSSALVAISLTMNHAILLRLLNLLGSALFVVYGLLVSTYPVVMTNAFLVCVNGFYLRRAILAKQLLDHQVEHLPNLDADPKFGAPECKDSQDNEQTTETLVDVELAHLTDTFVPSESDSEL